MNNDIEDDPATYSKFTVDDVMYYLDIFTDKARTGESATVHCTRCAELAAMLMQLRDLMVSDRERAVLTIWEVYQRSPMTNEQNDLTRKMIDALRTSE